MHKKVNRKKSLSGYLNSLKASDRYYFTIEELEKELGFARESISVQLSRLKKRGLVRMVKRGFGILYVGEGVEPHPSFYLDALMKHLGANYYVGLLAAAAYWGASHQSSMSYQVVVDKLVTDIKFERGRIEFIVKKDTFSNERSKRIAGQGGYYLVSSPELTAIDIVRFYKKCGYFNNVGTMLNDLAKKIDIRKLYSVCLDGLVPSVTLQRLGYILGEMLLLERESFYVHKALQQRRYNPALLNQVKLKDSQKRSDYKFNEKWKLYINEEVEID